MKTTALLLSFLLGAFSIFCAVLCDDPLSGVNMNVSDFFNNSFYHVQGNFSGGKNYTFEYSFPQGNFSGGNNEFVGYALPYVPIEDTADNSFIYSKVKHNITSSLMGITNHSKIVISSQWLTKFIPSVYTVVFIVALPLNLMAILMFLLKIKIKTPAIVYMLNLATADVLFVAVLPFNIVYRFSGNNWQIGEGMCRFAIASFYCNMYCSILLMTSMSVDRYLAVVFPIHSRSWRTKKRAWLVCILIWFVSIGSSVPLLITKQTFNIDSLNITTCHDVLNLEDQKHFYKYYFTAFSTIFFFLPLIITIFCYTNIVLTLSKSTKEIENSFKKKRAILLTILVLSVFIICFGPTNIIFLMHYLNLESEHSESLFYAYLLCSCISSISSCLDPVMYYYVSSRCRKYIYSLLCCKMFDKLQTKHQFLAPKESCTESSFVK